MVRELSINSFFIKMRESTLCDPYSSSSSSSLAALSPLLIFPSTSDVDSLCALKIIFHILESESIKYACYPVSSFTEIHKYLEPYLGADYSSAGIPLTLLLINWGSHRDLRRELRLGSLMRVFVVDSHRPIHLHNLNKDNGAVVVLYTLDDERQADLSYDFDVSELANACDLDSKDDIDVEEVNEGGSESDDEYGDESGHESGRIKKRRLADEAENDPVELFKKLKKQYYQMGTFHGMPSGCLMYELSHSLRKNTHELLWLACVSLTDQLVHDKLTNERYQAGVMELEQHINSLGSSEAITSVTLKDGSRIHAPDSSRIACEDEPKLMLLREWNLFDSMLCSSYIATKLKTWSDNGMKKLKLLLARMGFSLMDCQQKFKYMNLEVKRKMKDEFERLLPEYGLNELYYRSFLRLHGYGSRVSAADVVYGVTALLESSVQFDGSCAPNQFGVAYDALSLSNLDKLRTGIQSAIKVQRAILRQGSTAITKRGSIKSGRKFRWVKLEDSVDTKLLGYPLALTKFCYFVMDALRERGAKMKPLLCACVGEDQDRVLVVGVTGRPRLGAVQGNSFGLAFKTAAQETGADFFHELFESSWITLDKVAVNSFMIRLTEKL